MKRKYANVGERVKLIQPLSFVRCGYPLCSAEIDKSPELNKRKWELVNAAIAAMFPLEPKTHFGVPVTAMNLEWISQARDDNSCHYGVDPRIISKLEAAANIAILIEKNFGGPERRVFEEKLDAWDWREGKEYEVTKKRFVKTGKRFEGRSWRSWDGEHDYEPSILAGEQTHCVYQLDGWLETLAKNTERV